MKNIVIAAIAAAACVLGACVADDSATANQTWSEESAKAFLLEMLQEGLSPHSDPREFANKYMTPDYVQHVDGKTLDFEEFVNHLGVLRREFKEVDVIVHDVAVSGNKIADIHYVTAVKHDGGIVKAKVIGFFYMRGDKVAKLDELTYLIEGDEEDRDLGSRLD